MSDHIFEQLRATAEKIRNAHYREPEPIWVPVAYRPIFEAEGRELPPGFQWLEPMSGPHAGQCPADEETSE
ncbi:hypothetical protein [Hoyosella altamirensis]|uniref:hypothetical protein n=1 Tax=Hoyosella altamirensis TaxID=616997 RepID=UPI0007DB6456|nr:hypothetical protein [Hoyosella altamirensis]